MTEDQTDPNKQGGQTAAGTGETSAGESSGGAGKSTSGDAGGQGDLTPKVTEALARVRKIEEQLQAKKDDPKLQLQLAQAQLDAAKAESAMWQSRHDATSSQLSRQLQEATGAKATLEAQMTTIQQQVSGFQEQVDKLQSAKDAAEATAKAMQSQFELATYKQQRMSAESVPAELATLIKGETKEEIDAAIEAAKTAAQAISGKTVEDIQQKTIPTTTPRRREGEAVTEDYVRSLPTSDKKTLEELRRIGEEQRARVLAQRQPS